MGRILGLLLLLYGLGFVIYHTTPPEELQALTSAPVPASPGDPEEVLETLKQQLRDQDYPALYRLAQSACEQHQPYACFYGAFVLLSDLEVGVDFAEPPARYGQADSMLARCVANAEPDSILQRNCTGQRGLIQALGLITLADPARARALFESADYVQLVRQYPDRFGPKTHAALEAAGYRMD